MVPQEMFIKFEKWDEVGSIPWGQSFLKSLVWSINVCQSGYEHFIPLPGHAGVVEPLANIAPQWQGGELQ